MLTPGVLAFFFFFFFSRSALVSVCAHGGFLMAFSLAHSDNADAKAELTNLRSSSIKPSVLHKQGARANVLGFFFFFFPRMKEIDPSLWKSNIKGKHGRSYPSFICLFNKTMWSSSHILLKALSETELKKKTWGQPSKPKKVDEIKVQTGWGAGGDGCQEWCVTEGWQQRWGLQDGSETSMMYGPKTEALSERQEVAGMKMLLGFWLGWTESGIRWTDMKMKLEEQRLNVLYIFWGEEVLVLI